MLRRPLLYLVPLALAGCDHSTRGEPSEPGADARVAIVDAAIDVPVVPTADAATVADGAATADAPDPASCPPGVADGCCPLGIENGGADPDCPPLSCGTLHAGDPIPLDDPNADHGGGVGMAWTGRAVLLAWSSTTLSNANTVRTLWYERRDASGTLAFGPIVSPDPSAAAAAYPSGELGFHAPSGTLLFLSDNGTKRHSVVIGADGAPGPSAVLGETCNGGTQRQRVYPSQGRFLVATGNFTCDSLGQHTARIDLVGLDGKRVLSTWPTVTEGYYVGMAYDAAHDQVFFDYWPGQPSLLATTTYTPPSTWAYPPGTIENGDQEESAAAFDGKTYGLLLSREVLNPSHTYIVSTARFQRYTPGQTYPPAVPLDIGADQLQLPPRVVWTGDSWLVFVTVFPVTTTRTYDAELVAARTWIFHLTQDGTLLERIALSDGPTAMVNAVVTAGRVAITWLATDGTHDRHWLRWLDCH